MLYRGCQNLIAGGIGAVFIKLADAAPMPELLGF